MPDVGQRIPATMLTSFFDTHDRGVVHVREMKMRTWLATFSFTERTTTHGFRVARCEKGHRVQWLGGASLMVFSV